MKGSASIRHSLLIFFLLAEILFGRMVAQSRNDNYNFREFESKSYYFGLSFGYNNSSFQLAHSRKFILNDSFDIVEGLGGNGLNVAVIGNMKLGYYFDFRIIPGFSFIDRKFLFVDAVTEAEEIRKVESVLFQVPFQVRFKSDPFHDMRWYVLAGAKYSYDGASNADIQEDQAKRILIISPHDFTVEVGAGCQFFFPFFIFSPEIKYSQGLGNILIYNGDLMHSTVLEKVLSRTFTISLHFEG